MNHLGGVNMSQGSKELGHIMTKGGFTVAGRFTEPVKQRWPKYAEKYLKFKKYLRGLFAKNTHRSITIASLEAVTKRPEAETTLG